MYKVFVNDKPIIITSSTKKVNNFLRYSFNNIVIEDLIYNLKDKNSKGIILYTEQIEQDWHIFLQNFNLIPAAGGLVLNSKNEVLFIYRNNIWDLPKGWIDKGETIENAAIREVEEECGVFNLKIIKPLITTYHVYEHKGFNLKQTYWFLMTADATKELTPQLEEGITKVVFKNEQETQKALKNTYANIQLVYDTFKEG
ncbi:NUDIX domain-containing protein [uncultured Polaribacter sp.]|uniref:NUDIX hydrolase n=1 Tax=uncultured Polaribacter sp. TaxID=174711 RepID=UPI0026140FB7|nr:NUDIX domain-containing protein [uncultured Polaribacter sp.]